MSSGVDDLSALRIGQFWIFGLPNNYSVHQPSTFHDNLLNEWELFSDDAVGIPGG